MERHNKQLGFGLVETLVSLLVLTVGVLGMIGLHNKSLQYTQMSYLQSQGTILLSNMFERIRANKDIALTTTSYQTAMTEHVPTDCTEALYPNNCELASCAPSALAAYDVAQWKFQLVCYLPEATGSISFQSSGNSRIYILTLSFSQSIFAYKPDDIVFRSKI